MDENTQKIIDSITVKKYLTGSSLNAEPKYLLDHNKDCKEFRQRMMADAGDFERGYLFGTACICNGAEDHILEKIDVRIERGYCKDGLTIDTLQTGSIFGADAAEQMQQLAEGVQKGAKVSGIFGKETVTQISQGY